MLSMWVGCEQVLMTQEIMHCKVEQCNTEESPELFLILAVAVFLVSSDLFTNIFCFLLLDPPFLPFMITCVAGFQGRAWEVSLKCEGRDTLASRSLHISCSHAGYAPEKFSEIN